VALLPLSQDVDVQHLWNLILGAFTRAASDGLAQHAKGGEAMEEDPPAGDPYCPGSAILL
jgi:hypothetical protein